MDALGWEKSRLFPMQADGTMTLRALPPSDPLLLTPYGLYVQEGLGVRWVPKEDWVA
jgi:hypothetical protein